ncbi:MAG: hypothetical protein K2P14_00650 [Anaeroplasmataceae bacterium]|jgi:hypothetical protein|nr:hypothetical protein [Anaeroplasmataceae bacterium]
MNLEIEKVFIETFIKKDYQKRIIYELTKKREKALSRFSHNACDILNKDNNILLIYDKDSIVTLIQNKDILNKDCYFISRFFDGEIVKLEIALKEAFEDLCSSIIILTNLVIIKEETIIGKPNVYLIKIK